MKNSKRAFKGSIKQMPLKNYKAKVATAGFQGAGFCDASFRGAFQWTVLLGVILFASLFVGVGSLKAQEGKQARQQGWFVGVSPFVSGFEITTETSNIRTTTTKMEVSANIEITAVSNSYAGAIFDTTLDAARAISNGVYLVTWETLPNGRSEASQDEGIEAAIDICKQGSADISGTNILSLDATRGTVSQFSDNYLTDLSLERNNLCKNRFTELDFGSIGDIVTTSTRNVADAPTPTIPSPNFSRTDSLGGYGILFGYNLEKWGVSLQYYALTEGNNRLNSVIAVANYFLPYGFSVGAGLANLTLDTDLGSASKTAPAVQLGYDYSITKNLSVQAGALWSGSSLSVGNNLSSTTETYEIVSDEATFMDEKNDSLVLGIRKPNNLIVNDIEPDNRIEVTRTQTITETRRANVRSTTTNTENRVIKVKSTNAIYIRFVLRFK